MNRPSFELPEPPLGASLGFCAEVRFSLGEIVESLWIVFTGVPRKPLLPLPRRQPPHFEISVLLGLVFLLLVLCNYIFLLVCPFLSTLESPTVSPLHKLLKLIRLPEQWNFLPGPCRMTPSSWRWPHLSKNSQVAQEECYKVPLQVPEGLGVDQEGSKSP